MAAQEAPHAGLHQAVQLKPPVRKLPLGRNARLIVRLEASTPGRPNQEIAKIELRPHEAFEAMGRTFISYAIRKNGEAHGRVVHVANDGPLRLALRALAELVIR